MKLKQWLEKTGTTDTAFAKQMKLSRQIIHDYVKGNSLPTIPTAMRVEKETGGEVGLYDWTEGVDIHPKRNKKKNLAKAASFW